MTNHNESTQDKAVTRRPSRWRVFQEAAWTGTMAAVMIWLAARFWESPNWFDGVGMSVYGVFTGFFLATLIKVSRRRWVAVPTGYLDRNGDEWYVHPDGSLTHSMGNGGTWPLDLVDRECGPLEPIYG